MNLVECDHMIIIIYKVEIERKIEDIDFNHSRDKTMNTS